jgi:hypothetical protein
LGSHAIEIDENGEVPIELTGLKSVVEALL